MLTSGQCIVLDLQNNSADDELQPQVFVADEDSDMLLQAANALALNRQGGGGQPRNSSLDVAIRFLQLANLERTGRPARTSSLSHPGTAAAACPVRSHRGWKNGQAAANPVPARWYFDKEFSTHALPGQELALCK